MNARNLLRPALVLATLSQLSCAAAGLQPLPHTQPAERLGLAPEYRVFYDALQGTGDWVLVQPYGYVFRPDVNFIIWRPYEDGFWAPSNLYGWTWISAEPFGWATYHYGRWLYDHYYGWVWAPGLDWGPAWVTWQLAGDYAGWSPLADPGPADDQIRGGPWSYAPLGSLGATNLTSHLVHTSDLHIAVGQAHPVVNMAERNGVTFNRGPKFELVERAAGTLARVTIEEPASPATPRAGGAPKLGSKGAEKAQAAASESIEATRRAAAEATRVARDLADRGGPPPASLRVVRLTRAAGKALAKTPAASARDAAKGAPSDSASR